MKSSHATKMDSDESKNRLLKSSQSKEANNPAFDRSGGAGTILQMQREHGNGFVQRLLQDAAVQKQTTQLTTDEKQDRLQEKVDLNAVSSFNDQGDMEVDLSRLLDLRQFGDDGKTFAEKIDQWVGFGEFKLGKSNQYPTMKIQSLHNGKLIIKLVPKFQGDITQAYSAADPSKKPNLRNFFGPGLQVQASLLYNLEDTKIKESKLRIPEDAFDGQKELADPVLLIHFKGECGKDVLSKPLPLEGFTLLQALYKEDPEGKNNRHR